MPAWLLALFNPLNWLKIASAISSVAGVIRSLMDAIKERAANKKKDQIDQAVDEITKANEITDDEQRLKAKQDAMCKLEKINDPNSDCDR